MFVSGNGKISNGGDLFGPLVAQHVLQTRHATNVTVVTGPSENPPVISIVGSTLTKGIQRSNMIHWGVGFISASCKIKYQNPPNSTLLAVRGPRTRDLILAQLGYNPMVISDPALLAHDMMPHDAKTQNATTLPLCFVIHGVVCKYASEKCPFCMDRLVNNYSKRSMDILSNLHQCRRVVSSSLHGIIFSHALGIPALPIALGTCITGGDYKYINYMHSIGVTSFRTRLNV